MNSKFAQVNSHSVIIIFKCEKIRSPINSVA